MAVALDSTEIDDSGNNAAAVLNVTFVNSAGTTAFFGFHLRTPAGETGSTVKYNSVNATMIGREATQTSVNMEVWALDAPATGSNTAEFTPSASARMVGSCVSVTGSVDPPTGAGSGSDAYDVRFANGNTLTPRIAAVCRTGALGLLFVTKLNSTEAITEDGGITEREIDQTTSATAGNNVIGALATLAPTRGAETGGIGWTFTTTVRNWAVISVEVLAPAEGGGGTTVIGVVGS
jgi:hypothetical protein